jgi:hypothetical protein
LQEWKRARLPGGFIEQPRHELGLHEDTEVARWALEREHHAVKVLGYARKCHELLAERCPVIIHVRR